MAEYFEPKKKGHYKRRCHELMVEIWGDTKHGRAAAYLYLRQNFGQTIHFSRVHDEKLLQKIYTKLWLLSFHPPEDPRLPRKLRHKILRGEAKSGKVLSKNKQKKLKKLSYTKVVQPRDLLREVAQRNQAKPSYWKRFLAFFR